MSSLYINKVLITNLPTKGEVYNVASTIEHFKITSDGLTFYTPPSPSINKLPNNIIIKNSFGNEIVKIEFDITDNKFIITSTGELADNIHPNMNFFILKLYNVSTETSIKTAEILPNRNGDEFVESLNNFNFTFNENFLELSYFSPNEINITNYPSTGDIYIPTSNIAYFKITPMGLIDYTPSPKPIPPKPTSISIPQEIFIGILGDIKFNTSTYKLIVLSFQVIANSFLHNMVYLLFKVRDSLYNIKYHALYKADETMDNFSSFLNDRPFEINDIIEIDCISDQSMILKNFPNIGEREDINSSLFNLQGVKKFLTITENGLENYVPTNILPVDTLPNTIEINDSTGASIITLEFNTLDRVIRTFKFKNIVSHSMDYDYFTFKLLDRNNSLIWSSTLRTNTDVEDFIDEINFKIFNYFYVIELTYDDRSKSFINITNFPNKNDTHIPVLNVERYLITSTGFQTI